MIDLPVAESMIIEQRRQPNQLSDSDTIFNRTHLECDVCRDRLFAPTGRAAPVPDAIRGMGSSSATTWERFHASRRLYLSTLTAIQAQSKNRSWFALEINSMTASEQ